MSNELSNKDIINEQENKIQELNETISNLREVLADKVQEVKTLRANADANEGMMNYYKCEMEKLRQALESISITINLAKR